MPELDSGMVCHALNIEPGSKPIKQAKRNFHPKLEAQIKEKVEKLIVFGFTKPIKHHVWLANIIPVKKKNGQIRICVDF